jgi:hypothetical protein
VEAALPERTEESVDQANLTEEEVVLQVIISVKANGAIQVTPGEGFPEVAPQQLEALTRDIYEKLYEERIALRAVEVFKSRLG